MFDLNLQVRLKQARNALRDGRLDEAFAIANETAIRELRGGQILLESLVKPHLERAASHLAEGRLREAHLDVERAILAGGNRPHTAELRKKVREAQDLKEQEDRRQGELMDAARKHLEKGSLRTGREILADAESGAPEVQKFRQEVDHRERKGEEARGRAWKHLENEELLEALAAAREAVEADPRHGDLPELRAQLKKVILEATERALESGDLTAAEDLFAQLRSVAGDSLELRRVGDALSLSQDAVAAFRKGDFENSRAYLTKLEKALSGASWVEENLRDLAKVTEALPMLRAGPLGRTAPPPDTDGTALPASSTALSKQQRRILAAGESPETAPGLERLLLWIDGVGTYLILNTQRISMGRTGSSARPDIALAADLAGYHAEILRIEDDYFIVAAQGTVEVGGRKTSRKLLADGDSIRLGASCRFRFHLPTALSPTAVLTLERGQRIEGDVRKIVLFNELLLLGKEGKCHVEAPVAGDTVVLSAGSGGLVCRAPEEILVDAKAAGREALIPLGAHVEIGELTFTLTRSLQNGISRAL